MNAIQTMLLAHIPEAAALALVVFALLFALHTLLVRYGRAYPLRSIPTYEHLRRLVEESIETGQPLHVTPGRGEWGPATPSLIAGLAALDYIGQRAADGEGQVCVTMGSPEALVLAMNLLPARGVPGSCLLYGPQPLAYAVGAAAEGLRQPRTAHLLLGSFGDEVIWLAQALDAQGAPLLGGSSDPAVAALLRISTDQCVTGEDLFAAGAYLGRPLHLGSLAAEDAMRLLVAAALVVGALLATLGWGG